MPVKKKKTSKTPRTKKSSAKGWKAYFIEAIHENKRFYMIIGGFMVIAITLGIFRTLFLRPPCPFITDDGDKKVFKLDYKLK